MRYRLISVFVLAIVIAGGVAHSAENLQIVPIVSGDQVLVSFELSDAYTEEVREAIASGLRTTFTYDIDLRMAVSGWVDRTVHTAVVVTSTEYDNLTRHHTLTRTVDGRVLEAIVTDDEAAVRQWLTAVKRMPLCSTAELDPSRDYFVRIRARRRPSNASLLGWPSNVVGQARFTFIP